MTYLLPVLRPIPRAMITRSNHTRHLMYNPDGAFIFFHASLSREIILHLYLLLLRTPQHLSFHSHFLIAQAAPANPIVWKVSSRASYSGIKERIETLKPRSGGHLSLSTHGTCLAMLSVMLLPLRVPATPCFLSPQLPSIFRENLEGPTQRYTYCHLVCVVKVHAPNISPC